MLRRLSAVVIALAVLAGCGSDDGSDEARVIERAPEPTTTTTAPPPPIATVPPEAVATTLPPAVASGRPPVAANDPAGLAAQILQAETVARDAATNEVALHDAALLQQVAYRKLGVHQEWDAAVFAALPQWLHEAVWQNVVARREFRAMHTKLTDTVPPWHIVDPAPAAELLAAYKDAGAEFDVPWQVLAAINLVESGMGRIRGTSTAGAQGPMQFMPATWAAFGVGDINNPRDAIFAAARYLAHNGGAANLDGAIWNYNHSHHYVRGVLAYAKVMQQDERAFAAYHQWGVFYLTTLGDVWLPQGYEQTQKVPVADYLASHPQ